MQDAVHNKPTYAFLPALLLMVPAALLFVIQHKLLSYFYFGDEAETVVAAKMMAAGDRLYWHISNQHGPLTFLPQFLLEKAGVGGIRNGRISIAVFQWLALLTVYFSPLLRDWLSRVVAVMLAAVGISVFLPDMLGHTMQYHVLAGLILLVVMAQYTLPSIAGLPLSRWRVAAGSFLIASLPFLAVTYAPLAALMWLASARRSQLRTLVLAACAAALLNLLFLKLTGSLRGYWAMHIYMNSKLLQPYAGNPTPIDMMMTALRALGSSPGAFFTVCVALVVATQLARREARMLPWRTLLLAAALVSTLLRGTGPAGLYAVPIVYAALALPILALSNPGTLRRKPLLAGLVLIACFGRMLLAAEGEDARYAASPMPGKTPFGELAKAITQPGDRIISYSFSPHQYLAADRLPAAAEYFYLPWQADYEKKPILGVDMNACRDIETSRPKLISLDRWKVYDVYSWESYAGCIETIVERDYVPVPSMKGVYVRKDLEAQAASAVAALGE
jgi:hypothetical protein